MGQVWGAVGGLPSGGHSEGYGGTGVILVANTEQDLSGLG